MLGALESDSQMRITSSHLAGRMHDLWSSFRTRTGKCYSWKMIEEKGII